jgi:hypothetical protein
MARSGTQTNSHSYTNSHTQTHRLDKVGVGLDVCTQLNARQVNGVLVVLVDVLHE